MSPSKTDSVLFTYVATIALPSRWTANVADLNVLIIGIMRHKKGSNRFKGSDRPPQRVLSDVLINQNELLMHDATMDGRRIVENKNNLF